MHRLSLGFAKSLTYVQYLRWHSPSVSQREGVCGEVHAKGFTLQEQLGTSRSRASTIIRIRAQTTGGLTRDGLHTNGIGQLHTERIESPSWLEMLEIRE